MKEGLGNLRNEGEGNDSQRLWAAETSLVLLFNICELSLAFEGSACRTPTEPLEPLQRRAGQGGALGGSVSDFSLISSKSDPS